MQAACTRGVPFGWQFGTLKKWITGSRYAHLYNFDVQFAAVKGLVGMKLEREGETSEYNGYAKENAIQGTWFFLTKISDNGAGQQ